MKTLGADIKRKDSLPGRTCGEGPPGLWWGSRNKEPKSDCSDPNTKFRFRSANDGNDRVSTIGGIEGARATTNELVGTKRGSRQTRREQGDGSLRLEPDR